QSGTNRQGSAGTLDADTGAHLSARERELQSLAREVYEERLARGVAREQARKDLPLSTYTEAYWKVNLHNLLHFLALRMDTSAQQEIAAYADVIGNQLVQPWVPLTWEAFVDYRLQAMTLSRIEQAILGALNRDGADAATAMAEQVGLLAADGDRLNPNRERAELEEKLDRLGLRAPWL
ncbi:MAG: FAD-dependent thymidylate synthase, partial [Patescibacteria group bacterium]|nr:FAD-dependent thymidylate synthase [Patescibacteria group bacterium]